MTVLTPEQHEQVLTIAKGLMQRAKESAKQGEELCIRDTKLGTIVLRYEGAGVYEICTYGPTYLSIWRNNARFTETFLIEQVFVITLA